METARLGEIAAFSQGLQVPISEQETSCLSDDYVRFIRIVDYTEDTEDIRYIKRPDPRFLVNDDDIVMVRYGSASMGMVGRGKRGVIANNMFKISPDEKRVYKPYLFYCLQSDGVQSTIWLANASSTMPALTFTIAGSLEIPVHPLPVQRRIAGILSAYDELIENNQRRISILESMARALYREWFVKFKYPGHEKFPRVASTLGDIPQGWEATTLGAHLTSLESGKRPKGGIRDIEDGVPSIGAENIDGIGRHGFAGEKFVTRDFFQEMRKGVIHDRDVAIYKDGAYIGKSSYFRDGFPHVESCVNEHVFLLRSNGIRLKQNTLYLWLQESDTIHAIRATNANAAQPGINQQSVSGLELVVPDEETADGFDRLVEPMLAEIINFAKKIQNLRRTRELLLPRLLSGQVNDEEV